MDKATPDQDKCSVGEKFWGKYQNVYKDSGISFNSRDTFCVKCRDTIEGSKKVSDRALFENDKRFKSNAGSSAMNEASGTDNSSGSRENSNVTCSTSSASGGSILLGSKVIEVANKRKSPLSPEMEEVANPPDNKRRRIRQNSIKTGVRQEEVDPKGSDTDADGQGDASESGSEVENSGTESQSKVVGDSDGMETAADLLTVNNILEKEQTYDQFDGLEKEDFDYILEDIFGMTTVSDGFALQKATNGVNNLVIKSGNIIIGHALPRSYEPKQKFKIGNWSTVFKPGLFEAIRDVYQDYDRVIFPVDFIHCNPRLVKRGKELQSDHVIQNARCWNRNALSHTALIVHDRTSNLFSYHDSLNTDISSDKANKNRKMCRQPANAKKNKKIYRELANTSVVRGLRCYLPIRPLPKDGDNDTSPRQFFSETTDFPTTIRKGSSLLPLRIIEALLLEGRHISSWLHEQESRNFCLKVMGWCKKGVDEGKIVRPQNPKMVNRQPQPKTFHGRYMAYVKKETGDPQEVLISHDLILKWMRTSSSLQSYCSDMSKIFVQSERNAVSYAVFRRMVVSLAKVHNLDLKILFEEFKLEVEVEEHVDLKGSDSYDEEDGLGSGSEVEYSCTEAELDDDDAAGISLPSGEKGQGRVSEESLPCNDDSNPRSFNLASASHPSSPSGTDHCVLGNMTVDSPAAPIDPLPTSAEANGNLHGEAMTRQVDCSVMMALKKMYAGGKLLDDSLKVIRKQTDEIVNIHFSTSIFRLWRIMCPKDTFRPLQKLSNDVLQIDSEGIETLKTFVMYLHTGVTLNPTQLLDFLGSSPITFTDPFILGLIILQSVFGMGLEDYKALQSQIRTTENSREFKLLAECLGLGGERKEMIMAMFKWMRESYTETTFYLTMRQNQKSVYTMEERRMMFQGLYSEYSNTPEAPHIRILLANMPPDSSEEADLKFQCKGSDKELYNFKCHSIVLMLHHYQEPGNVDSDFVAVVERIRGNLRDKSFDKRIMSSFIKIMYKMGGNEPGKIGISIKMLVDLSELFCISNPMERFFGRVVPDSGINLRLFLDFFDDTEEPKYLKDILANPLTYLTTCNAASLRTKQMECILQSDDLRMCEMAVYRLVIGFAKSKPCPDEDENFRQVPQRMEYLVKFVRFGLMEKKYFEEVAEKEKLIPIETRMAFSYLLKYPDEEIKNVPAYMHKPFVKRNS